MNRLFYFLTLISLMANASSVKLEWTPVEENMLYKIQILNSNSKVILSKTVNNSLYEFQPLQTGKYFWQVAVIDEYGQVGHFSPRALIDIEAKEIALKKRLVKKYDKELFLEWDGSDYATYYKIFDMEEDKYIAKTTDPFFLFKPLENRSYVLQIHTFDKDKRLIQKSKSLSFQIQGIIPILKKSTISILFLPENQTTFSVGFITSTGKLEYESSSANKGIKNDISSYGVEFSYLNDSFSKNNFSVSSTIELHTVNTGASVNNESEDVSSFYYNGDTYFGYKFLRDKKVNLSFLFGLSYFTVPLVDSRDDKYQENFLSIASPTSMINFQYTFNEKISFKIAYELLSIGVVNESLARQTVSMRHRLLDSYITVKYSQVKYENIYETYLYEDENALTYDSTTYNINWSILY